MTTISDKILSWRLQALGLLKIYSLQVFFWKKWLKFKKKIMGMGQVKSWVFHVKWAQIVSPRLVVCVLRVNAQRAPKLRRFTKMNVNWFRTRDRIINGRAVRRKKMHTRKHQHQDSSKTQKRAFRNTPPALMNGRNTQSTKSQFMRKIMTSWLDWRRGLCQTRQVEVWAQKEKKLIFSMTETITKFSLKHRRSRKCELKSWAPFPTWELGNFWRWLWKLTMICGKKLLRCSWLVQWIRFLGKQSVPCGWNPTKLLPQVRIVASLKLYQMLCQFPRSRKKVGKIRQLWIISGTNLASLTGRSTEKRWTTLPILWQPIRSCVTLRRLRTVTTKISW